MLADDPPSGRSVFHLHADDANNNPTDADVDDDRSGIHLTLKSTKVRRSQQPAHKGRLSKELCERCGERDGGEISLTVGWGFYRQR